MLVLILLIALVAWIIIGVIGFVVKGLFWLFILACVLFAASVLLGAFHGGRRSRRVPR